MRVVALVMLTGCQLLFEQLPEPIDSGLDAMDCPGYERVGELASRYRLIVTPSSRDDQAASCEADGSRAYLVVLDSAQETADLVAAFAQANLAWVGIRQAPNAGLEDAMWIWDRTDAALDLQIVNWAPNEPNDGGDGENNAENIAALGGAGLFDLPVNDKRAAICECD